MKVTCNHCGEKNELGRMFCMACGKRMHITNDDVDQAQGEQQAFKPVSVFRPLAILALMAFLGSALWPAPPFAIGVPEKERGAAIERVKNRMNGLLAAAQEKRAVKASFTADELSFYLKNRPEATIDPAAFSFRLEGSRLFVREQIRLRPFTLGGKAIGPFRFSREVTYEPVGRIFLARSGRFGHLPLPGPLHALVSASVGSAFVLTPAEQAIDKQLNQIGIRDGKLELVLGP